MVSVGKDLVKVSVGQKACDCVAQVSLSKGVSWSL